MTHPQKFLVIGYCDSAWKQRGTEDITFSRDEHQFVSDHIPTQVDLKAHAMRHQYWPSRKPRADSGCCQPIYTQIGDGLDYTACTACFPNREVTDNRIGPDA